jgi:hypothetical protein
MSQPPVKPRNPRLIYLSEVKVCGKRELICDIVFVCLIALFSVGVAFGVALLSVAWYAVAWLWRSSKVQR